jgi:hypothetical protein
MNELNEEKNEMINDKWPMSNGDWSILSGGEWSGEKKREKSGFVQ